MSTKTAEDLVNSPIVQKYIEAIDTDAEAALDLAKSVTGSATAKLYSSSTLSAYKADATRLDNCWGDFNAAWNKVVFGRAKDSKEIIKTYSKYVLALEVLEQSNTKHEAMMSAGFALLVAALLDLLLRWIKGLKTRLKALEKELKAIQALLKKAKKDVTGAKAQLALNVVVTGISFCLGPVGWGARIGVAVGGIVTHVVIDAALGPSQGSALGTVNTAAGESVELVDKLASGSKKMAGAAAAAVTLGMDLGEIGQAEKIVKDVQKRLKVAAAEYESLIRDSRKWNGQIGKTKKQYDAALKAYEAAAKKFKSSQRKREGLLKEFKQWK